MATTEGSGTKRWHWKDWTLLALAAAVLLLAFVLGGVLAGRWLGEAEGRRPAAGAGEAVAVFEVDLDRDGRRYLEVLFDQPLGEGRVGEVLGRAPATLSPPLGGAWRWRDTHALRFELTDPLPAATEIEIELIPERLLAEGQGFTGDTTFTLRTDPFLLERTDAVEEPAFEGRNRVVFRGTLRFNYPVEPEELAPRIRLIDPLLGDAEPVTVELEAYWRTTQIGFTTGAVEKRPDERTLTLVIDGDLTPADGNVRLAPRADFRHQIPLGSSERLAVRSLAPEPGEDGSRLTIELSSPVVPALAGRFLTVEPAGGGAALPMRLSGERNWLVASGPLLPGERYRVRLAAGMPSRDDASLQQDWVEEVTIPNLPASLDFESEGMFLSSSGLRNVALTSVNVARAELSLGRVYLNNLFFLFRHRGFAPTNRGWVGYLDSSLGDVLAEETVQIDAERNHRVRTPVTLDPLLEGERPGLYRLTVKAAGSYQGVERWLLLTDLGVVAKRGSDGLEVWVSSFADLSPVAGARVRLVSDQNQEIAAGRTDGAGRLRIADDRSPGGEESRFEADRPYFLTVERGGDFTFLLFDQTRVDTAGLDVGGASVGEGGYRGFLWGERDLYRPGETVEAAAVVRDEALAAPPPMPVVLRHDDPRGRRRGSWTRTTDRAGVAELSFEVPPYALTGAHSLTLEIGEETVGSYRFQVEEFVPDRIKVEIDPRLPEGAAGVGPGEELAFGVSSAYLFGPPAAGLPVEARVRLADADFGAPGYEGYSFRDDEREFDEREILAQEGTLDESGEAAFAVTLPAGASVPSALEALLTARVRETGGRGVTARSRVRVDPYPYYLGLKRPEGYADPGAAAGFEWVALAPDGSEARAGALRADLYRERWNTVLRRTPAGTYRYETSKEAELLDSLAVQGGAASGRFELTPPETGSYRLVLTDPATAAAAAVSFYASGWGFAPWAVENPARVELDLDREEYAPGETAVVQVRAPFPGRLILTVERGRVYDSQVHRLTGNTAAIEVPVRGAYRPNAYVTATLLRSSRDLEPGAPGRAFGAVALPVDRAANRLAPEIEAPEEVRPESRLSLAVETAPGARVTLAAVDEGILQLVAQKTPDPFEFFYRKLALGVETFDVFSLLLPEVEGAVVGGGEGGEGLAQYVRTEGIRRVEPVAFWSGVLTAGASGRVEAVFELPEFTGALRLMAVALDGREFGSAERSVRVRSPLVLLPTAPRVLAPGDRAELPVTARNDTGREGEVKVELAASGAATAEGEASQSARLADGGETTLYFPITAGEGEDASFVFTAAGLEETARARVAVPVRPALPPLTEEIAGALEEPRLALDPRAPERFRPETLARTLHLGPVPLVQFGGRLEDLVAYPYGCLEQTVSAAFPLIYLEDLAKALEPKLFEEHDPAALVLAGIRRVSDMQLYDGGFALWPGGDDAHPWGSLYATHFLVEAAAAGYPVEDYVLDQALDWTAGEALAKDTYGSDELERVAYALYVLVRGGRPDLPTLDFVRERHAGSLRSPSRALVAAAYAGLGDRRAVAELVGRIERIDQLERQTGGNFGSTIRDRSLLLLALLEAAPEDRRVPELVDRLARESGQVPRWSTQEASFLFLALGRFYQRQGERPPYAGRVLVGGREVGRFGAGATSFRDLPGTGQVVVEMDPGYQAGSAFYSLRSRGVPTDEAFRPRASGLEVERRVLTREGRPADLAAVAQGDLLVVRTRVRSVAGPVENVVVENLLPGGLEVENPRLETTETLPWVDDANLVPAYLDLRDDRVLLFVDLPADTWQTVYALVRAVTPGVWRLPPIHAEAMYDPALSATGPVGEMTVRVGR